MYHDYYYPGKGLCVYLLFLVLGWPGTDYFHWRSKLGGGYVSRFALQRAHWEGLRAAGINEFDDDGIYTSRRKLHICKISADRDKTYLLVIQPYQDKCSLLCNMCMCDQ